jgi:hypothetical protein
MIVDRDPIVLAAEDGDAPTVDLAEFALPRQQRGGAGNQVPRHER